MNSSPLVSPRGASGRSSRLGQDLRALAAVLTSPVATFRRIGPGSRWLVPWITLSVATAALMLLTVSITQRVSVHLLAEVDDPVLLESVDRQLRQMRWVSLGLAPVHVLGQWGITAALLWSLGALGMGAVRFGTALTIAAYAAVPSVLGKGLDLGVTWFEGPEFSTGMVPVITSASSLAVLLPGLEQPEWLVAMMRHVTVFTLWGAALWAIGLRQIGSSRTTRAVAAATIVWVVFLAAATAGEVVSTSLGRMAMAG